MLGVRFGNNHSWNDWGILRVNVENDPPEIQRYTIEVPGRNGLLDLTPSLTNKVCYGPRNIICTFQVKSGGWTALLSRIMNEVHGRTLNVYDDLDPDHYWRGICSYDSFASDEKTGTLVLTCQADPYKYQVNETVETLTGSGTLVCENDRMEVIPEITVTEETTIVFGTVSATLAAGTHKVADIEFTEGDYELEITGSGTTTIRYRQGRL